MITTFQPVGSSAKRTLNAGSAEYEPMSGLNVRVSRRTDILQPVNSAPTVLPDGGQMISLTWSTWITKSSGALHNFDRLRQPYTYETGTLEITAPDGVVLILTPAALTSRKASPSVGKTYGWSYSVLATDYVISANAVDYILDLDHSVLRDLDGSIITDLES